MKGWIAVTIVVVALAGAAAWRFWPALFEAVEDFLEDDLMILPKPIGPTRPMKTIVLWRKGGTVLADDHDDATEDRSSVVQFGKKERAVIPPFRGSDASWKKLVACVEKKFAAYDVLVVEERPVNGYVLVMVGGTPDLVGAKSNIVGLGPFNGDPIEDPIAFVFARRIGDDVRVLCDTVAHEVGHVYGLDHAYLCKDPMTYLPACGERQFQDVDAECGEKKKRACHGGAMKQNTHRTLRDLLGVAPATVRPAAPARPPSPAARKQVSAGAGTSP